MNISQDIEVFEQLTQRTDQVIFIYEPQSSTLKVNAAFERIWQLAPQSIENKPSILLESLHPQDLAMLTHTYQQVRSGQENKAVEFRILLPDDTVRWICLKPFLVRGQEGKTWLTGFASDITDGRTHEETLKKFSAKKDAVLEILSHDLAGPIGRIKSLASVLAEKLESYQDFRLTEIVHIIESTCGFNLRLIRELLHQEYLESTEIVLIKGRINLAQKIKETVDQYQRAQENIDKRFELFSSSPEIEVCVDEVKFIQVINNLISNAIKFTHKEGIITIRIDEQEKSVLITVADNGIGIPLHLQPYLFDKFTKARRPGLQGEETVGLGLAVVKTIVDLHKGKVWLESEEKEGTTFFVEIPKE